MKYLTTEKIFAILLTLFIFIGFRYSDEKEVKAFIHEDATELAAHNPYVRTGLASWYSRKSPGIRKRTANNEKFNDRLMTCAMWGVPFNQRVKVTNLENGKSIVLRVNDRGPHRRYVEQGRIIDLTESAFKELDSTKKGLIPVSVEFIL